jgi:LemA protein
VFILIVLLLIAVLVFGVLLYNKLKALAEAVRSRRANILAVTRKRADLAARLVDIANGYGSHEKVAQLQISEDLTSMAGLMSANAGADRVIGQVSSLAAAFPDLKANQTFQQLMLQLEKIETEVLQRRENYNHVVEQYNSYRVRLPQALVANACNFDEAPYFETGSSGLETLAEFKTGDTKAVEDLFRRAGERAKTLASTTHAQWKESRLSASGEGHLDEPDPKKLSNGAP